MGDRTGDRTGPDPGGVEADDRVQDGPGRWTSGTYSLCGLCVWNMALPPVEKQHSTGSSETS